MKRPRYGFFLSTLVPLVVLWGLVAAWPTDSSRLVCSRWSEVDEILQLTGDRAVMLSVSPPWTGRVTRTETEYEIIFDATATHGEVTFSINRYTAQGERWVDSLMTNVRCEPDAAPRI